MRKILVVQNSGEELKSIDSILPKEEFEIFYSHNLNDGLEIALHYLPNLILLLLNNDSGGIDVLRKIANDEKCSVIPLIVISQKHSIEEFRSAMELGADDYFSIDEVEKTLLTAINKRFEKLAKIKASVSNQINSFEQETVKSKRDDHILVKIGNKLKLVKFTEIVCISALKEYSKLTTKDNCKIVVRKSLKNWIALLPSKSFLQIHRATIINIEYIDKIVKANERTYTVHLKHISQSFDFSHRYANVMRQTFPS